MNEAPALDPDPVTEKLAKILEELDLHRDILFRIALAVGVELECYGHDPGQ